MAELKTSRQIEWPTLLLVIFCYAGWGVATTWLSAVLLPAGILLCTLTIALHSSLQHEVLHGHPFPNRRASEALVFPALGLLVPYLRFRDTHLQHHNDETLTDPYDDPETNYSDPAVWRRLPAWRRRVLTWNNTLLGRLLLGPLIGQIRFMANDLRAIVGGDGAVLRAWLWHIPAVAVVLVWLWILGEMPGWAYALSAYAGLSILKIRTFLEHKADEDAAGRTVIIEDRGPLALIFLNNNLHLVHHMHPGAPWYRLPQIYMRDRRRYLDRNGEYIYRSYAEVFRKYFLQGKDPVPHPLWTDDGRRRP